MGEFFFFALFRTKYIRAYIKMYLVQQRRWPKQSIRSPGNTGGAGLTRPRTYITYSSVMRPLTGLVKHLCVMMHRQHYSIKADPVYTGGHHRQHNSSQVCRGRHSIESTVTTVLRTGGNTVGSGCWEKLRSEFRHAIRLVGLIVRKWFAFKQRRKQTTRLRLI